MSAAPFLIAGALIFYAGIVLGAALHHRRAFAQGYVKCLYDSAADDRARELGPSEFRVAEQRRAAPWQ